MIKRIAVVSNTHWDREFRHSFEKTRHNLLVMLDTTLDILENDPDYHSFTMDGHSIMIDDYLEIRPERTEQVKKFVSMGRLIIGPYYTLPEEFTVSHEALIRNLQFGKSTVEKYGGKIGTVAYTPSSWGQTGQYPQILKDFGLDKMMFYRGISHHESDAEYIWQAPDGTQVFASRFALYCRYNWYYQVHRAVTRGRVWDKNYIWGEFDEVPFRLASGNINSSANYELKAPAANYNKANLRQAILDMLEEEKGHFTTSVFLAMNGHDISVAFPLESKVIADAKVLFKNEIEIEHTDLEQFWKDAIPEFNNLTTLTGERRSYLKEGKWTFLFPGTISARTYLKQADFMAYNNLTYIAEPLNAISGIDSKNYLNRGWNYLLSNHTHDANGGCAPDEVCLDMQYRYRKVNDIAEIVAEDAMAYIAKNLDGTGQKDDIIQLIVFNTLPYNRDAVVKLDLEIPSAFGNGIIIENVELHPIMSEKSSSFVDSIWEVPTILDSMHHIVYAEIRDIPAMGYKTFEIKGKKASNIRKMFTSGGNAIENENLKVTVNSNGSVNVINKLTDKVYENLNYFTSQGEVGNAWKHVYPDFDKKHSTLGCNAKIVVTEIGELLSSITATIDFYVPSDCIKVQNENLVNIPIKVKYTLEKNSTSLKVEVELNNTAKDHWLRANFPTDIQTEFSIADSHFDIVKRPIAIPDSTGWVEQIFGTHPLRTFATVTDGENGFAVLPHGLFEYEVFEDSTMALTLIRACRIKLAVSEEKVTELDDDGVQCPGENTFTYALNFYKGEFSELPNVAADLFSELQCAVIGRGKGTLPLQNSLFSIDNKNVHITAVKQANDGNGTIVRLFNGSETEQRLTFFGVSEIKLCKMTEEVVGDYNGTILPKKIVTVRI